MNKSPSPLEQAVHWLVTGLVFLLPLAYLPAAFDMFGAPKIFLVRIAAAALSAITLILLGTGKLSRPANKPLMIAVAVYLLVLMLATAFSVAPLTSLIGLRRRYFGLLTYVSELTIFLSLALVAWRREQILLVLKALVASSTLVAVIGITQSLGSSFPFDLKEQFASSAYSTLGNPNFTGILLAMTLPITAYLGTQWRMANGGNDELQMANGEWRKASRRGSTPPSLARRVTSLLITPYSLLLTAFLIQVAGLLATRSSGAIVGALLGLAAYALVMIIGRESINKGLSVAIILAAMTILIVAAIALGRGETISIGSRLRGWRASAKLVAAYPVTGVGPDTMRYKMGRYLEPDKRYNQGLFEDGHNLFMTTAGTTGVAGLAAYLAILALAGKALLNDRRQETGDGDKPPLSFPRKRESRDLALALLAALIAYVAAEMVNPDDIVPLTVFWVVLGCAQSLRRPETGDGRPGRAKAVIARQLPRRPKQSHKIATSASRGRRLLAMTSWIAASPAAPRNDNINPNWWPAVAVPAVGASLILLYIAFANLGAELSLQKAETAASFTPTVEAFLEAQARFPYYDWYYVRLADRLGGMVKQGDDNAFQVAEAAARQAVNVSPLESDNYVWLGTVYRYQAEAIGDNNLLATAAGNYKQALTLNPQSLFAVRDLALTYAAAGDYRRARAWAARFAVLAPDPEAALLRKEIGVIKNDASR